MSLALYENEHRTRRDLEEAEEAFRRVIDITGGALPSARYSLARTLVALAKLEEAVAVGHQLLEDLPQGQLSDRVRVLVCSLAQAAGSETDVPAKTAPIYIENFRLSWGRQARNKDRPKVSDSAEGERASPANAVVVTGDVRRPVKIAVVPLDSAPKRGVMILMSTIDRAGCVKDVQVLKGKPGRAEAAVAALRKWVFRPATLNGEPIAVYFNVTTK